MSANPTWWNLGVWVGLWLGLFCILEGLAAFGRKVGIDVPWDTFSRFIWDLQVRWDLLAVPIIAILAILASHLVRFRSLAEGDRRFRRRRRR